MMWTFKNKFEVRELVYEATPLFILHSLIHRSEIS